MKTPYEILEVPEDAGDTEIKKAYLSMVRRYPPERSPDDFQRIYKAYELIQTAEDRLSYRLFHCTLPEPADIAALLLQPPAGRDKLTKEQFQKQFDRHLQTYCKRLRI